MIVRDVTSREDKNERIGRKQTLDLRLNKKRVERRMIVGLSL